MQNENSLMIQGNNKFNLCSSGYHYKIIGYCYYCKKDLCFSCCVKWNSDIYGNKIEKFDSFIKVCQDCTLTGEIVISQIKRIRSEANSQIQNLVDRFVIERIEESGR